jgi:glutaconate CoA-transferase subunit A
MLGSELLDRLLEQEDAVRLECDPFSGKPVVALAPIRPDVAIVHVDRADEAGNAVVAGPTWGLREAACAARATILLAEEVVPVGSLDPDGITIPGPFVSAVAHVRWAAYPTAAVGLYDYDREHLEMYVAAAVEGGAAYARYLDEYIYGVDSHEEFLERAGVSA